MTSKDEQPASPGASPVPPSAGRVSPSARRVSPGEPALPEAARPGPALPEQSREDTDEGWGEYPERDDDWLRRDRPPHWADL